MARHTGRISQLNQPPSQRHNRPERGDPISNAKSRRQTRRLAAPFTGYDPTEHNAGVARRKAREKARKRLVAARRSGDRPAVQDALLELMRLANWPYRSHAQQRALHSVWKGSSSVAGTSLHGRFAIADEVEPEERARFRARVFGQFVDPGARQSDYVLASGGSA